MHSAIRLGGEGHTVLDRLGGLVWPKAASYALLMVVQKAHPQSLGDGVITVDQKIRNF